MPGRTTATALVGTSIRTPADRVIVVFRQRVTMNHKEQRLLDSLRRVRDFMDAHSAVVGPLNTSEGRRLLDDAVTRIAGHTDNQGASNLEMAGQVSQEKSLITDLRTRHMTPIA